MPAHDVVQRVEVTPGTVEVGALEGDPGLGEEGVRATRGAVGVRGTGLRLLDMALGPPQVALERLHVGQRAQVPAARLGGRGVRSPGEHGGDLAAACVLDRAAAKWVLSSSLSSVMLEGAVGRTSTSGGSTAPGAGITRGSPQVPSARISTSAQPHVGESCAWSVARGRGTVGPATQAGGCVCRERGLPGRGVQ